MNPKCDVEGCENRRRYRTPGFCNKHYLKKWEYGDPLAGGTRAPNGAGRTRGDGYRVKSIDYELRLEHVLIVERVLGKPLPPGAIVHHHDTNRSNNANENLVVCPNEAYHQLLHRRMRALDACGNPNFIRCRYCKTYDDPARLYHPAGRPGGYHMACQTNYQRNRREAARS